MLIAEFRSRISGTSMAESAVFRVIEGSAGSISCSLRKRSTSAIFSARMLLPSRLAIAWSREAHEEIAINRTNNTGTERTTRTTPGEESDEPKIDQERRIRSLLMILFPDDYTGHHHPLLPPGEGIRQRSIVSQELATLSGKSSRTTGPDCLEIQKKEIAPIVSDEGDHGSPGWIRTNNQVINSHLLCQLSYRGSEDTSGWERYSATRKLSTRAGRSGPLMRPTTAISYIDFTQLYAILRPRRK